MAQPSKRQLKREKRESERALRGTPAWEINRALLVALGHAFWVSPIAKSTLKILSPHTMQIKIRDKTYLLNLTEVKTSDEEPLEKEETVVCPLCRKPATYTRQPPGEPSPICMDCWEYKYK